MKFKSSIAAAIALAVAAVPMMNAEAAFNCQANQIFTKICVRNCGDFLPDSCEDLQTMIARLCGKPLPACTGQESQTNGCITEADNKTQESKGQGCRPETEAGQSEGQGGQQETEAGQSEGQGCRPETEAGQSEGQGGQQETEAGQSKEQDNQQETEQAPDKNNQGDVQISTFGQEVVRLVNEERAKHGLPALQISAQVQNAAGIRVKEQAKLFSHTRPNGSSFATALTEAGAAFRGAGENIAYGQTAPGQVMNGWMNSSGHRANILNASYTAIGVGYEVINGTPYWVQLFTY